MTIWRRRGAVDCLVLILVMSSATLVTELQGQAQTFGSLEPPLMRQSPWPRRGVTGGGLANGSFEADYAGWTVSGNQLVVSGAPFTATDGAKAVAFNVGQKTPNGVLSQSFTTTAGQVYTLAFDAGAFSQVNTRQQRMQVRVQGTTLLLAQTVTVAAPGNGTRWVPQSLTFLADSAAATLTFEDTSLTSSGVDLMLDHVRVTQGGLPGEMTNGSFESDYSGWTASGHQVIASNDPSRPATDGVKAVVFNGGNSTPTGIVAQTFATSPGQRYGLTFDLGAVGAVSDQRMRVTVEGTGFLVDQTLVLAGIDAGPFYVPQHISFVANSTSTKASFFDASLSYGTVDMLLDNVRVVEEGAQAPLITQQPQRTATAQGGSATFTVGASGTGPLTYQWHFGGAPIPGASSNAYTVTGATAAKAGNYSVVVGNTAGSVSSSAATLTVLPSAVLLNGSFEYGAAGWTLNNDNVATTLNTSYAFTDGTQLMHFNFGQRPANGIISQSFATIVGAQYQLAFDMGAFSFANQNEQRMRLTLQGGGPVPLVEQNLSVFAPGNGTRYLPQTVNFVADSTMTTVIFQDTSTATINVDLVLDHVRVTLQGAPVITAQLQSLTVSAGNGASSSVTAGSLEPPLMRQSPLPRNGVTGGGFTNGSFEADYAGWTVSGNQSVVSGAPFTATDGAKVVAFNVGQKTPNGVLSQSFTTTAGQMYTLAFDAGAFSQVNTRQQRMQVRVQGTTLLLAQTVTVAAPGNGTRWVPQSLTFLADSAAATLTFQDTSLTSSGVDLMLDHVRVTQGGLPEGMTNGSFESDYSGWTASGHQVIASNDPSRPATDGVKAVVFNANDLIGTGVLSQVFATIPGQRYGLTFDLGTAGGIADQLMRVIIEGDGVLLDETLIVSAPTAAAFYVPQHISFVANSSATTLTFADDSYTYVNIDLLLDHVSNVAEEDEAPLVIAQPMRKAVVQGGSVTFNVGVSGPGPFTYEWQFAGGNIPGATSSSYTVTGANASKAGNYSVVVTNAAGSVSSSAATLTVLPPGTVLNGSFEYGVAAWTFTGNVSISTNPNYGVTDGTQLVHFNWGQQAPNGVVSQTIATTPGQTYTLAFDVGAFSTLNTNEQRMQVTVQGSSPLQSRNISVSAPGNGGAYMPQIVTFVANSSATILSFRDISLTTTNVDLLLDNVRVTAP